MVGASPCDAPDNADEQDQDEAGHDKTDDQHQPRRRAGAELDGRPARGQLAGGHQVQAGQEIALPGRFHLSAQ